MIDLTIAKTEIKKVFRETLAQFEKEHKDIKWSMVAIDSNPIYGWMAVNFDTQQRSDEHVEEFKDNGPDWYGEDVKGQFCNNCADYEYYAYKEIPFPQWEEEYNENNENSEKFQYINTAGEQKSIDLEELGDEGLNQIIFDLLKEILVEELSFVSATSKNTSPTSRIGVQICDSYFDDFHLLENS